MSERNAIIKLQIKDPKSLEMFKDIVGSISGLRLANGNHNGNYTDLLIYEIGENPHAEFQFINSVQNSSQAGEIFLTSQSTEPEILLEALRVGAKEFLPQPLNREEVKSALIKFRERRERTRHGTDTSTGKLIAVIGSKGGVGTTSIAVNLAASLAGANGKKSVSLMDTNLFFGEVPLFLDMKSPLNWGEIAKDITRVDSTYLASVLGKHSSGIHVLPAPTRLDAMQGATPDNMEIILGHMKGVFNYTVVDTGHILNDLSLKVLELAETILVASVLTLPCLINAKKLIDILQEMEGISEGKIRILINRRQKKSMITVEEAEKSLNKRIFWSLPNDYAASTAAINQGRTICSLPMKSELADSFKGLAAALGDRREKEIDKGLFGNLFGKRR
jgi:pilus assembly protein CpaE